MQSTTDLSFGIKGGKAKLKCVCFNPDDTGNLLIRFSIRNIAAARVGTPCRHPAKLAHTHSSVRLPTYLTMVCARLYLRGIWKAHEHTHTQTNKQTRNTYARTLRNSWHSPCLSYGTVRTYITCLYLCVYIYTYTHMHMHIHTYTKIHIHEHIHTHTYTVIHTHTCVFVYIYMFIFVYTCVTV